MGNQMSSPQYHGRETLHSAGSGVESEWREVGRSERGGRGGGRIEKGTELYYKVECLQPCSPLEARGMGVFSSMNQLQYIAYMK